MLRLKKICSEFFESMSSLVFVLTLTSHIALGQEAPDFIEVSAGYGYSDNIARQSDDPVTSGMSIIGLNADWLAERPLYEFSLNSDLDYIFYSDDRLRDRPDGRLSLAFTSHLVPDIVDWSVFNDFTQVREDVTLGDTPDNLRRYNVLGTTLDIRLPLGRRTSFGGTGTYERRKSETSLDIDSESVSGGLNLTRRISRRQSVSANVDASQIVYDDALETEFEIQRAYVRYESELATGRIELDVGANRLEDSFPGSGSDTTPLYRLTWQRQIASRSQMILSGVYQWSDLGASAALGGDPSDENSGILNPLSNPFKERRVSFDLTTSLAVTTVRFALSASDQEYDSPFVQDFRFYSASLQIDRQLARGFSIVAGGSYGDRRNDLPEDDAKDVFASLGVGKSLGNRYRILFSYQHRTRDAQNGSDFEENQFRIDLIARLRG